MRALSSSSSAPAKLLSPLGRTYSLSSLRRRFVLVSSKKPLIGNLRFASSGLVVFSSVAERRGLNTISWFSPELNSGDGYGGWTVSEPPVRFHDKKRGLPILVIGGVGASLVFLVSAIAYLSLKNKGFKFQISSPGNGVNVVDSRKNESILVDDDECDRDLVSDLGLSSDLESNAVSEAVTISEKVERVIIPVAVDSTQREALSVLKKLKILEDDVRDDALCTRREYCRWLVRLNSLLERDARRRIIPFVSLWGSTKAAFDDVCVEDVDFESIQALAEAGVLPSKLSQNSSYNELEGNGVARFFPDRFVSRLDLIDWKAQLDYDEADPRMIFDQIMTTKIGFMDMKEMKFEASSGLYKDMLAGDKGIIRKVFGQIKRFQPNKPSTIAQAAVALTSGRMTEAIRNELLRLEAESSTRKAEMEAIWSELVERGDIKSVWDVKLNEEKSRGVEVEKVYLSAVRDLENEKIVQEKHASENLKEKVAMDCQRQLLLSLNEEVNGMSEKLASERISYVVEQSNLREMRIDLESKQEGILDTKSILEAEIEALRILRSWVEDEARKSQARAKVLEEVGRRWKWDDQS